MNRIAEPLKGLFTFAVLVGGLQPALSAPIVAVPLDEVQPQEKDMTLTPQEAAYGVALTLGQNSTLMADRFAYHSACAADGKTHVVMLVDVSVSMDDSVKDQLNIPKRLADIQDGDRLVDGLLRGLIKRDDADAFIRSSDAEKKINDLITGYTIGHDDASHRYLFIQKVGQLIIAPGCTTYGADYDADDKAYRAALKIFRAGGPSVTP